MYGEFAARTVRSFVAIALATVLAGALAVSPAQGQEVRNPFSELAALHDIVADVSADRVEADIRRLAGFGTRHTLSDTLSDTRGIGAARRWRRASPVVFPWPIGAYEPLEWLERDP